MNERRSEGANERTNERTGVTAGMKEERRNSNKRMKTSLGKKRAHFDNGFVYEGQRYLRGSVGIWWAIAAGSPRKARTLTCANQHTQNANNVSIYSIDFVPVDTFISFFFLIFSLNHAVPYLPQSRYSFILQFSFDYVLMFVMSYN